MVGKVIRSEADFSKWFMNNFISLGYSKIIRKYNGTFPDFIMEKNGKNVKVELETRASHFILHGHDKTKVDEVICIKKDVKLDVPLIEISELKFIPRIERISATIDEGTSKKIEKLIKDKKYRNKSHFIEDAINNLLEEVGNE